MIAWSFGIRRCDRGRRSIPCGVAIRVDRPYAVPMADGTRIADFLFEAGLLARTPRSGFAFLGSGAQSVAEHTHRTTIAAYVLAHRDGSVDTNRVLRMCLFHDLPEVRTSDHNYLSRQYNTTHEQQAIADLTDQLSFGDEVKSLIEEFERGESDEARIAKDADQIELILSLKELLDNGNQRARDWIEDALPRLKTDAARELARTILDTDSHHWYLRRTQTHP